MATAHAKAPQPTSVYRYYDKFGLLLYVGITSRGAVRNAEHYSTKTWWRYVVRQEVDHYDTREAAGHVESELIRRFRPPFNTQLNPWYAEIRAAYLAMQALHESPARLAAKRIGRNRLQMAVQSAGRTAYLTSGGPGAALIVTDEPQVSGAKLRTLTLDQDGVVTAVVDVKRGAVVGASLMYRHERDGRYSVKRIDVDVLADGEAS